MNNSHYKVISKDNFNEEQQVYRESVKFVGDAFKFKPRTKFLKDLYVDGDSDFENGCVTQGMVYVSGNTTMKNDVRVSYNPEENGQVDTNDKNYRIVFNGTVTAKNNCLFGTKGKFEQDTKLNDHCHILAGGVFKGTLRGGDHCKIGNGTIAYLDVIFNSHIKIGNGSTFWSSFTANGVKWRLGSGCKFHGGWSLTGSSGIGGNGCEFHGGGEFGPFATFGIGTNINGIAILDDGFITGNGSRINNGCIRRGSIEAGNGSIGFELENFTYRAKQDEKETQAQSAAPAACFVIVFDV